MTASAWHVLDSDERRALRESVRALAAATWGRLQRLEASDPKPRKQLWDGLRAIGVIGLTVPTTSGSGGGDIADAAALACEVGRNLLPLSTAESLILAPQVLAAARPGDPAMTAGVLDGSRRATVHSGLPRSLVAGLTESDVLLQVTPAPDGTAAVHAYERAVLTPWVRPAPDDDYYGDAALDRWPEEGLGHPVGSVPSETVRELANLCAVLHCFEMIGALQGLITQTAQHLSQREQFGRRLIEFQALQHRLADLSLGLHLAETAALDALRRESGDAAGDGLEAGEALDYVAHTYQDCVEAALQLHGAMGFTWEAGLHRYLRHAIRVTSLRAGERARS